jgi:murein DD-endopeptidase MepM/ murein hydrolase activator NlpD
VFFLYKPFIKLQIKKHGFLVALTAAALILGWSSPALARLDELLLSNKPYMIPPVALGKEAGLRLYEVKAGDTLTGIAAANGISVETLALANRITDKDRIKVGQTLQIPADCVAHQVQRGETLWEISRAYRVDVQTIASRNGRSDPDTILAGQTLMIPLSNAGEEVVPAGSGSLLARGWLVWPLQGPISSPFGMRDGRPHEGIDIAVDEGTPIRAAAAGRVVFAGPRGTYGLTVIVDHGDGVRTLYAHCSEILVDEGDEVNTRTVLALAGSTGRSTGPHLHLEVLKNGTPLNPEAYLAQGHYYG